ncbi:hypothetical protein RSSM_05468 [Rhodopirellula sallentina SM41]|uniref:Uncharacterized protein n=1 Tax=Rhodopirellula sallentina SM41 TaxID=1263870 RepID=M5TVM0_9BACT|nr:hypothetical protein RSSM_05468 [Rhodopirellula sallentina SM41]
MSQFSIGWTLRFFSFVPSFCVTSKVFFEPWLLLSSGTGMT